MMNISEPKKGCITNKNIPENTRGHFSKISHANLLLQDSKILCGSTPIKYKIRVVQNTKL